MIRLPFLIRFFPPMGWSESRALQNRLRVIFTMIMNNFGGTPVDEHQNPETRGFRPKAMFRARWPSTSTCRSHIFRGN